MLMYVMGFIAYASLIFMFIIVIYSLFRISSDISMIEEDEEMLRIIEAYVKNIEREGENE